MRTIEEIFEELMYYIGIGIDCGFFDDEEIGKIDKLENEFYLQNPPIEQQEGFWIRQEGELK